MQKINRSPVQQALDAAIAADPATAEEIASLKQSGSDTASMVRDAEELLITLMSFEAYGIDTGDLIRDLAEVVIEHPHSPNPVATEAVIVKHLGGLN